MQNAQGERLRDRFLIVRRDGLQGTHGHVPGADYLPRDGQQGTHGSGTRGRSFLPRVPVRSVVVSEVFYYGLLD